MLDDKNCQEFSSVVCLGLLEMILYIMAGQQIAKQSRVPDSTCPLWDFGTTTEGNTFESTGFLVFRVDFIFYGYNNFHISQIASLHPCYDNLQNIFGSF